MQNMPARARKTARPAGDTGDLGHFGPSATPAPSRNVEAGVQIVRPSGESPNSPVLGACNVRLQRLDVIDAAITSANWIAI